MPFHVPAPHLGADGRDAERVQLVRLHQGDHHGGVPGGDRVEVGAEVALVRAGHAVRLLLAGREGDADQAAAVPNGNSAMRSGLLVLVRGCGSGRAGHRVPRVG